jgi:hypothetical protein
MHVVATKSFSIPVLAFFAAWKQRPRTTPTYSAMLRRVNSPPFGNTNYDAFIPAIMTQFDDLTGIEDGCTILT